MRVREEKRRRREEEEKKKRREEEEKRREEGFFNRDRYRCKIQTFKADLPLLEMIITCANRRSLLSLQVIFSLW